MKGRRQPAVLRALACALPALLLVGCAGTAPQAPTAPKPARPSAAAANNLAAPSPAGGSVVARSDRQLIYAAQAQDSFAAIAERFLGSAEREWEVAEANPGVKPGAGTLLVVPLKPANPMGARGDHYQVVPILCYHRIGTGSGKMTVSPAAFAQQLTWLADNGYRVVRLRELLAFLDGRRALPRRSVVLTFDDGYESYYRHAYPLLKKHGFPATVFLYTDFVGAADALSWAQMREMAASGLVDIQAHSKTHANLLDRYPNETEAAYRARLDTEARASREQIRRHLVHEVDLFAYPYGDANDTVLGVLGEQKYRLAVTVNPGGTPFYSQPLMLRRTMIFGSHDLEAFKARLETSRPIVAPAFP